MEAGRGKRERVRNHFWETTEVGWRTPEISVVSDRVNDRSDPLTGQRGQKGQSTLTRSNAKRGNKFGVVKDDEIYNITYKSCGWNSNVKGRIA